MLNSEPLPRLCFSLGAHLAAVQLDEAAHHREADAEAALARARQPRVGPARTD